MYKQNSFGKKFYFIEHESLNICGKRKDLLIKSVSTKSLLNAPLQKQPTRGVLRKRCFSWVFSNKFAAYFQNTFFKNTSGWLLLSSNYNDSDLPKTWPLFFLLLLFIIIITTTTIILIIIVIITTIRTIALNVNIINLFYQPKLKLCMKDINTRILTQDCQEFLLQSKREIIRTFSRFKV